MAKAIETATGKPEATDTAIVKPADAPLAAVPVHPLMTTINDAVKSGRSGADLKELLDLYERMEAKMEEKAYDRDFLAFQQECKPLPRTGTSAEVTDPGTRFSFTFCKLSDLDTALPVFWKHGFTREFGTLRLEAGKAILECTFRHRDGHSVTKEAEMLTDSNFLKNAQNRVIGATSYLKRMVFGNMLGVPVCDLENKPPPEPAETITEEQANELNDLLIQATQKDTPEASSLLYTEWKHRLLDKFKIEELGGVPASEFGDIAKKLQAKIDADRKDGT